MRRGSHYDLPANPTGRRCYPRIGRCTKSCEGTGKMACPFCDDGEIYSKMPPPPNLLPIYCQPPVTSVATTGQPRNTDTSVLPPEALERSQAPVNPKDFAPPQAVPRNRFIMLSTLLFLLFLG